MARDTLQIRIVTGEGLLHDQDWGTYEGLTEAELKQATAHFELAAVGTLLDFVHPQMLEMLLEVKSISGVVLDELGTCWQGQLLEPGTAYGVLLGEDRVQSFAQRSVLAALQEEMGADRFREARARGDFATVLEQGPPGAQKNVWKPPRGSLPESVRAKLRERLPPPPNRGSVSVKGNKDDGHLRWNLS